MVVVQENNRECSREIFEQCTQTPLYDIVDTTMDATIWLFYDAEDAKVKKKKIDCFILYLLENLITIFKQSRQK
jgi:hypothetical protein